MLSLSYNLSFFFKSSLSHPDLHSFPTRRSSDLRLVDATACDHFDLVDVRRVVGEDPLDADAVRNLADGEGRAGRSEEHTSELQSQSNLVCRLLLEKKKNPNRVQDSVDKPSHSDV